MATSDEVKAALEDEIGRKARPNLWELIVRGKVYKTALGLDPLTHVFDAQIGRLAEAYRRLARINMHPENLTHSEVTELPADRRLEALAEIMALDAGRLPAVAEFRSRCLPDGLLGEEDVGTWIRSRVRDNHESAMFVTFAVPPEMPLPAGGQIDVGWLIDLAAIIAAEHPGWTSPVRSRFERLWFRAGDEFHPDMLGYAGELDEIYDPQPHAQAVPVSPGTELWELRALSRGLALRNGWTEAAATNFVLTGVAPAAFKATGSICRRSPFGALTRILVEADPRLTPADVRRLYGRLRSRLRGGGDHKMDEKHIQLALFLARDGTRLPKSVGLEIESEWHEDRDRRPAARVGTLAPDSTGEGAPWLQLLRRWNQLCEAEHPEWAYWDDPDARRFSRDVRNAWRRVTGQPWWSPLTDHEAAEREA